MSKSLEQSRIRRTVDSVWFGDKILLVYIFSGDSYVRYASIRVERQ
jgi:hypothetical protein